MGQNEKNINDLSLFFLYKKKLLLRHKFEIPLLPTQKLRVRGKVY